MQLNASFKEQALVVSLEGDLDLSVSGKLREALESELDNAPGKNLVIDMSRVNFIDSSGLGVLLGRYNRVSGEGGKVILTGLKPQVKNILELSGLLRIMEEYASTSEALSKIS